MYKSNLEKNTKYRYDLISIRNIKGLTVDINDDTLYTNLDFAE